MRSAFSLMVLGPLAPPPPGAPGQGACVPEPVQIQMQESWGPRGLVWAFVPACGWSWGCVPITLNKPQTRVSHIPRLREVPRCTELTRPVRAGGRGPAVHPRRGLADMAGIVTNTGRSYLRPLGSWAVPVIPSPSHYRPLRLVGSDLAGRWRGWCVSAP